MTPSAMRPSRLMTALVEEWNIGFIDPADVGDALDQLRAIRPGIADEDDPTCLVAYAVETMSHGPSAERPKVCGQPADRGSHSIQENGVLDKISRTGSDGAEEVLKFFPGTETVANLAKAPGGHPGSDWLWNIQRIPPLPIPITLASVGHFACSHHDQSTEFLGLADNLAIPGGHRHTVVTERNRSGPWRHAYEQLLMLAYRTLLYRISQLRGLEIVTTLKRLDLIRANNRFGVELMDASLTEIASLNTELYREKDVFDRKMLGVANKSIVHHVGEIDPYVGLARKVGEIADFTGRFQTLRADH